MKEYQAKSFALTEYEGHRWNTQNKTWDRISAKKGPEALLKKIQPGKYSMVESGGFFYNTFRLLHWW